MLSEEAKAMQREYKRQWRAKNKVKVHEYNKRYWEKKAEERRAAENGKNST